MAIAREPLTPEDDNENAAKRVRSRSRGNAPVTKLQPSQPTTESPDQAADKADSTRRRKTLPVDTRVLSALVLLVLGIVLVMLGWYGAAHTNIFTEQIPYVISGGLLGVALIIVAGIVASAASTERQTKLLRQDLARAMDALSYTGRPSTSLPERVLLVPGGRTYHVPGCPIPEGKDVTTMPLDEARATGLAACKLCAAE